MKAMGLGFGLPALPNEGHVDWNISHERLLQKHNILMGSYQELALARNQLESKLRSTQRSNREWVEYANGLEKKIGRLQGKLTSHGIPLKRCLEGSPFGIIPPILPPSSRELVLVKTGEASHETLRRELPNLLHMSERISELARNATIETAGRESQYPSKPTSTDGTERQQGGSDSNDAPLPLLKDAVRLRCHPSALDRHVSTLSPKLLMDVASENHHSVHPVSPEPHQSGSTEEDVDVLPSLRNRDQVDVPPPIIKAEPLSDTPVIISSRSVKKMKTRTVTGSNESASYANVKVEVVTSSPIGLTGFQNLFPQESMDLDEIGEKMNTPKKRRQAMPASHNECDPTAYQRLPAQLVQAVRLERGENNAQSEGYPSALQPSSSNKMILPRTSGNERESKRRRLGDRMRGAGILAEDGENYMDFKIGPDTETQTEQAEKIRKLPANTAELQRRLSGLLEKPSPEKRVLTPSKPPFLAATPQFRAKAAPAEKYERFTPSNQRKIGAVTTPNVIAISLEKPKTHYKPSTAKKRSARIPKDTVAFETDDPDQEPLRTRPVRRLGLEHFKVNPNFNHGSDYAFKDVVRGRELRKCLPGCTKPECCGDKFRKFIEFAREHEEQTLSQEEENTRLLEEYLGDNKARLRNMTQEEKEELLIQARTRDLANKASKHRHAYERRRSPPGFWRSDFPSTQELQTDRQEAANRERELVQQRYEEAMRPGGRWLFRDE